ncbi:hypothetical protein FEM08_36520 [Flavobacterium gilvum]|nr:hypothetical protein FEM08_36520 [Flavobacterium gilvum]
MNFRKRIDLIRLLLNFYLPQGSQRFSPLCLYTAMSAKLCVPCAL